jgi:hypothetical protein
MAAGQFMSNTMTSVAIVFEKMDMIGSPVLRQTGAAMTKLNWQRSRFRGRLTLDWRDNNDTAAKWLKGLRGTKLHPNITYTLPPAACTTANSSTEGDPCPRCGRTTKVCEHEHITDKQLKKPYYYSRWFYCQNPHCKTTVIMPERYKVFNSEQKAQRRSSYSITANSSTEAPPW